MYVGYECPPMHVLQRNVRTITELRNMLEATPHRRSRPAGAVTSMPSAPTGTSIEHKVRLSLLPSTATSTLTASATKQAGDVERGYCDVTKGAGAIPVGTTILVQQNEAQPSVLSKYQVGKNHFIFITLHCDDKWAFLANMCAP